MKIIDVTKSKATFVIGCVIIAIWFPLFYFSIKEINGILYILAVIAITLLNRVAHEMCHYIANRAMGFECKLRFGFPTSECKVYGTQNSKQLIISAVAPAFIYVCIALVILVVNMEQSYRLASISILALLISTMAGDFQYIYYALTNKEATFIDDGTTLKISQ